MSTQGKFLILLFFLLTCCNTMDVEYEKLRKQFEMSKAGISRHAAFASIIYTVETEESNSETESPNSYPKQNMKPSNSLNFRENENNLDQEMQITPVKKSDFKEEHSKIEVEGDCEICEEKVKQIYCLEKSKTLCKMQFGSFILLFFKSKFT